MKDSLMSERNREFKKWVKMEYGKSFRSCEKAWRYHISIMKRDF